MSALVAAEWAIPSRSRPGVVHRVGVTEHGHWYCTCPGGVYRRRCAHIDERARAWRAGGNHMSIAMIASRETAIAPATDPTAPVDRSAVLPAPATWDQMVGMAAKLQASKLLPRHVTSPEAAVAIMLAGWELGVPAMQALRSIYLIDGSLSCSANLMLALIQRARAGDLIVTETTDDQCTVEYRRREWTEPRRHTFTMAMAKRAGLSGKDNWSKYPDAMLRARCISAAARLAFADVIAGMYTPEELGAAVTITPEGDVLDVTVAAPPPRPAPTAPAVPVTPDELSEAAETARHRRRRAVKAAADSDDGMAEVFAAVTRDVFGKPNSHGLTDEEWEILADVADRRIPFAIDHDGRYRLDFSDPDADGTINAI